MHLDSDTLLALAGMLVASSFFWEFLKWFIDKIVTSFTGEKKVTMSEISDKLDRQRKDIDKLQNTFTEMQGTEAEKDAQAARRRILRFDDELLRNVDHSKEYFDDILEDVRVYEEYCKSHPRFQNGKTVMADKNIRRCYENCMDKHSFLT